jgi:hypothetical protein
LPYDNFDEDLERMFVALVGDGEVGIATYFAALFSHTCKPKFALDSNRLPVDVWCYNPIVSLWEAVTYNVWKLRLQAHCMTELRVLSNKLSEIVADRLARYDYKASHRSPKAWSAAKLRLMRTMAKVSSLATLNNIAEIAANLMRDPTFPSKLDAVRDILSFQNGVVNLRNGELRPRTIDDCISYVLPYEYDTDADMSLITSFVHSMFEDPASEAAMQAHVGYMATAETSQKVFYQFTSLPHTGKSTFLKAITNALGLYASMGEVPIAEFLAPSQFETSIVAVVTRQPPLRLLVADEGRAESFLNEELVNIVSSGLAEIQVPLRMKHLTATVLYRWRAKLVLSSNHTFRLPSGALGTAARMQGPALRLQFVDPYDPATALDTTRPRDTRMVDELMGDRSRAGIARWIVVGCQAFYESNALLSSPSWDAQRVRMQWKGDVFVDWLSDQYFPTGVMADRVDVNTLRTDFSTARKQAKNVDALIRSALEGMGSYVSLLEWEEVARGAHFVAQPGVAGVFPRERIVGYGGLRLRRVGDVSWAEAASVACVIAANARRALVQAT